jgi:hypothetical protein
MKERREVPCLRREATRLRRTVSRAIVSVHDRVVNVAIRELYRGRRQGCVIYRWLCRNNVAAKRPSPSPPGSRGQAQSDPLGTAQDKNGQCRLSVKSDR